MIKFTIPGELTDLNSYIKAERSNKHVAAKIKQNETDRCAIEARVSRIQEVPEEMYPVKISYRWYTINRRKDVDNVTFAKKFINDGLVAAMIIEDDSRKYVEMMQDLSIEVDKKNPRIEVQIEAMVKLERIATSRRGKCNVKEKGAKKKSKEETVTVL